MGNFLPPLYRACPLCRARFCQHPTLPADIAAEALKDALASARRKIQRLLRRRYNNRGELIADETPDEVEWFQRLAAIGEHLGQIVTPDLSRDPVEASDEASQRLVPQLRRIDRLIPQLEPHSETSHRMRIIETLLLDVHIDMDHYQGRLVDI
jgi:hypothetical protein